MPLCQYCRHLNPVGHDRCTKCQRWISLAPEPPSTTGANQAAGAREPSAELPTDITPLNAAAAESPFDAEVRELAARKGKIDAIKLYRERTGVGLAEAKQAVEALIAGRRPVMAGSEEEQLLSLLRANRKIEAIRIYRHSSGQGLKESKEHVEALGRRHGIQSASGCGTTALAMLLLFAAGSAWLAVLLAGVINAAS